MANEEIYQLLNDCLPKIFNADNTNIEMFSLPIVDNNKEFICAEVYILSEKRFFFTNNALYYRKATTEKAYITKTVPYNEIKNIRCGKESIYILLHSNSWVIISIEDFNPNELCHMLETIQNIYQPDIKNIFEENSDIDYISNDSEEDKNLDNAHRTRPHYTPISSEDFTLIPYNRDAYIDTTAMKNYKENYFGERNSAVCEYNPNITIHKTQAPARNKYGDKHYTQHSCDVDHINPVKKSVEDMERSPLGNLLTHEQRLAIINNTENLAMINASLNRSKGKKSNIQYVNEHPELDIITKETMTKKGQEAQKYMKQSVRKQALKNEMGRAGQAAVFGLVQGACSEGSYQYQIQKEAVKNGEKTKKEAFKDGFKNTAEYAGKSAGIAALIQVTTDLIIALVKAKIK